MNKHGLLLWAASITVAMHSVAVADDAVPIGRFSIDRNEVSIARFDAYVQATGKRTAAEREGGGYEWGAGWERRAGWTYKTPFGSSSEQTLPAVHVSWSEASAFCVWAGGRLPSREEWVSAAYVEKGAGKAFGFETGRSFIYPTGSSPAGANTSDDDAWPQLASVATTKAGVNGLFDMGGNAWEWLADRDGDSALTAGGSWWYGADKMRQDAMQWKPAEFYAVYVGFRCVYNRT